MPVFGIVLGGTMTASAVAARRALDALSLRAGEVEAALSLGLSERDSRMEVIGRPLSDALLPNLDQARTADWWHFAGAFVGVLLATGSAAQAGAVQVLLISLLLSQAYPEAKSKPNAAETWILFRASGTEPLLRIYTESTSKEAVARLLESGKAFAMGQ